MMINHFLVSRSNQYQVSNRHQVELFKNLLQPHFLFNSLNNLYALSLIKSDQTPEAIACLSRLLERIVTISRKDLIPLSEEIELIEDYISMEKTWLGDCSFQLDFQVKGNTDNISIPPLTIYTLVENAFKHGIRRSGEKGWITFHLAVKHERILMKIRNSVEEGENPDQLQALSEPRPGLGIQAVRKLLEGSYRNSYYLDARTIGNVYAVDLIIGRAAA